GAAGVGQHQRGPCRVRKSDRAGARSIRLPVVLWPCARGCKAAAGCRRSLSAVPRTGAECSSGRKRKSPPPRPEAMKKKPKNQNANPKYGFLLIPFWDFVLGFWDLGFGFWDLLSSLPSRSATSPDARKRVANRSRRQRRSIPTTIFAATRQRRHPPRRPPR